MEAMDAHNLQQDLNHTLTEAMTDINNYVYFTLQRDFYKCAYRCFDEHGTMPRIEPCVEQCGLPSQRAQNIISSELSSFQERIQRSVLVCRDRMDEQRDTSSLTDDQLNRNAKDCVERAIKGHISGIPKLTAKIKSQITVEK